MMKPVETVPVTLRELFSVTPQGLAPTLRFSAGEYPERLDREKLRQLRTIEHSPHFAELVGEHVCGFLTGSVAGILAGSWHSYRELKEAGRQTLADPGLHSKVILSEHSFSYELTPSLELLAGGFVLGEIEFEIEAEFAVHGLALSVRRGCVDAILSGDADCSLSINCCGGTVFSRKLVAVELPGTARLPKPVTLVAAPVVPPPLVAPPVVPPPPVGQTGVQAAAGAH